MATSLASRQSSSGTRARPAQPHAIRTPAVANLQRRLGNDGMARLIARSAGAPAHSPAAGYGEPGERPVALEGKPCDPAHEKKVPYAQSLAKSWLSTTRKWFDAHNQHLRGAAPAREGRAPVGMRIVQDLRLLDRHFRVSERISKEGGLFPRSADDRIDAADLVRFAHASFDIRGRFDAVRVANPFVCLPTCPRGRRGGHWAASAEPGSGRLTVYTPCFDGQGPQGQAHTVLHEAFHATFAEFTDDSYHDEADYPGRTPVVNADSYATFATILAIGAVPRLVVLPEERIEGKVR